MPELKLDNSIVDDRYLVERCLSLGSYAEIFLAQDQDRDSEQVIIKALNTTLQGTPDADLEQTLVENFQNEALALDKVLHPNIIRRLGHGTAIDLQGTSFHYLVLEYMPGGDMLQLCRKSPLSIDDTLFYFEQVCRALAYAHNKQVIHRDIKPNNLLLSADRSLVKVADFGVAKIANAADTGEITRVGTNIYAPPEHHPDSHTGDLVEDGQERLTPSADIYSLAKTIITAMTGKAPHQFSRQPISRLPDSLMGMTWAATLLAVLNKATETRIADRYQTIEEFWEDFGQVQTAEALAGLGKDPEATLVRPRTEGGATLALGSANGTGVLGSLGATAIDGAAPIGSPAPRPDFQAPASITGSRETGLPQKARIVIELPEHQEPPSVSAPAAAHIDTRSASEPHAGPRTANPVVHPAASGQENAPAIGTATGTVGPAGASVFHTTLTPASDRALASRPNGMLSKMGRVKGPELLRWIFIACMVMVLVGVVTSTYLHFAGRPSQPIWPFSGPEGALTRTVNIRSEPNFGTVLAVLPSGSKVRILETRDSDNWIRVKVLDWSGSRPQDAPDSGWVDGHYVQR